MKTMTKKLGAIVLALALCLSLCCTALAAETQTYSSSTDTKFTIEINPAYSEETYTAYKIFDVTYSDPDTEGNVSYSYTIDSSSAWYTQVSAATDVFVLTPIGETGVYNVTLVDGVEKEKVIAVFNSIPEGAVVAATEQADKAQNQDGSSGTTKVTLDVTESGAGYYYITTTLGTVVTIDTTNPTAAVSDKNTPPTLEKKVDYVDEESVDNHVEVNYEFTIEHVHGINHLVLEDAMQITDEGVSYTFDPYSLTVQLIDGEEQTTLTLGTDYTVLWKDAEEESDRPEDDCDFHVVFTVDGVDYDFSSCSDNAYVYVTVNCALDADDAYFQNDEVEIPNHAMVTYGNGGNTVWDEADIYEYAFHIYKYTGDIETEGGSTPLEDAHFSLTNNNTESENYGLTAYFEVNSAGDYMLQGWTDDVGEIPEGYTADLVSGAAGNIKIDGLAEGSYILTETQAPDGYNKLEQPIEVTIVADEDDPGSFTVNGAGHTINVENNGGSELPSTGGIGTTIFYIIGGVLVAGAVVVLITRRRMSSEG